MTANKLSNFIGYFLIGSIAFVLFFSFQGASQTLLCPDSFYHAKMASFLAEGNLIKDFPWLPYTTLSHSYANHHFLYHWLLVPFFLIFPPLIGIKVATLFFTTLTIIIFYWFLKKFEIKLPFFWTFLLLTSSVFLTRLNLAKAPAAIIPILLFGLYALFKRKYILLIIVSFAYVWFYGTWPIIIVMTIIYCFANAIKKTINRWEDIKNKLGVRNQESRIQKIRYSLSVVCCSFKSLFAKENIELISACLLGTACGLIINPYFPENIYFYWMQIVKIGLQNYQNILPVGAEWLPYNPINLVFDNFLIFFSWIIGSAWFFFSAKKTKNLSFSGQPVKTFALFLISVLFFFYTVKSRRNIDYFIPLAVLSGAFSLNNLIVGLPWKLYFNRFKKNRENLRFNLMVGLTSLAILTLIIFSIFSVYKNIWIMKKNAFTEGANFNQLEGVANSLKETASPGEIIFHSSWGEFPSLFYHNHQNAYISGLDPTFAYIENKPLYWLWFNITTGKQKNNLAETIGNNFKSRFVFIGSDYKKIKPNFEENEKFEKTYEDKSGTIYKIIDKIYFENY